MSTTSQGSKPSSGWQPPSLEDMQAMLPQYRFEKLLGRGGMGAVYKAVQTSLDRAVAIKVLPGDLIDDADAQFAERFKNEARTMAKMSHPSIVNVFDFGETQTGLLYIVMEFIDGTDVAQMILSQGRLPEEYALSITAHVCDALAYAHQRGVIHRDIKPANILINLEGAVKVADFGLAKQSDPNQSGLTKTNMAMGTPDFVAPEALIPGVPLDGRADLYAIGVMLYNMLTGEIPRGMWSMPAQKVGSDPRFDAIIAKAMQTDREARFQSAAEIRQELDTILALPRSVIIAQQQAAAEATAKATRAQKEAEAAQSASPPVARPAAKSPSPPPAKAKSSNAPILGLAAAFVLAAGLWWMMSNKQPTTIAPTPAADVSAVQPLPSSEPAVPSTPVPMPNTAAEPPMPAAPLATMPAPPQAEPIAPPAPSATVPKAPPPVASTPTTSSPDRPMEPSVAVPVPEAHPDPLIARLDKSFKARLEADALAPYRDGLAKLDASYLANGIPRVRAAAQAKGSLREVTALDVEKARMEQKRGMPDQDDADTPESLKNLRQTYRSALAKLITNRDEKATPLYDIYLKSLDEHITALTKAGQIPQAQAAQAWRDDLSRQKPGSVSSIVSTTAAIPSPAAIKAPVPPAGDSNTWRRAAEYLVTHGGFAVAVREGSRIDIRKPEDIPEDPHDLIELTIDHLNSGRPDPNEDEFQVFNGLRELRRVWIRIPESRLKVNAYTWLSGNQRLEMVNFESAGKITDEVLTYLAEARDLQELHIQYAPQFTGAGLERMPFIDTLTLADFQSTGIAEKGMRAISSMKKLTTLRVNGATLSDKAMSALAGHKSLLNFDASFATLGDETAAILASMPQLVSINLSRTKLTDKGLAKLSVLKNLTSLMVTDSAVTAKAAQAFEKDMPTCRVTR